MENPKITRCKDCVFFIGNEYSNVGHCSMWNKTTVNVGYCYRAETEEVEDE